MQVLKHPTSIARQPLGKLKFHSKTGDAMYRRPERRHAMLTYKKQTELAEVYQVGIQTRVLRESFNQSYVEKGLQLAVLEEMEIEACVLFVDIADFSTKMKGQSARKTAAFLEDFYRVVIPTIYGFGGLVDRIAGDGIVAIFSPKLTASTSLSIHPLRAAEQIVRSCHGKPYEAKAAISWGNVLLCETGITAVYEDLTVIGEPLTVAYRLEEVAMANQVVAPSGSPPGVTISAEQAKRTIDNSRRRDQGHPEDLDWKVWTHEVQAKGIGLIKVKIQQYQQ